MIEFQSMCSSFKRFSNRQNIYALFFLAIWLLYGTLINSGNLREFNLQHTGIEAIVERGVFYLEGTKTKELVIGDVDNFEYRGHLYTAKQPGQFLIGALAYFFVHTFGFSYARDFLSTSALVTFLTASLIAAGAVLIVFALARVFAPPSSWLAPLLVAFGYAVGTTAFPYAGIEHHDVMGTGFLVAAFYVLFRSARVVDSARAIWLARLGGIFLGLVITMSMLPALMVAVVALYAISYLRWQSIAWLAGGVFIGLLPLFAYDTINFGNPFLLPNIVGDYSDTFFYLDTENFLSKLQFYVTFLAQYTPLALAGLIGWIFLPRAFRREQVLILAAVAAQAAYVFNIDTVGHCQSGPRYLLPTMPFLALGLIGFAHLQPSVARTVVGLIVGVVGLISIGFNFLGAVFGAMCCDIQWYAVPYYWKLLQRGDLPTFPLGWLAIPLMVCVIFLIVEFTRQCKTPAVQI